MLQQAAMLQPRSEREVFRQRTTFNRKNTSFLKKFNVQLRSRNSYMMEEYDDMMYKTFDL